MTRQDIFAAERTKLVAEGYYPRYAPPGEPTPWVRLDAPNYRDAVVLVERGGAAVRVMYYDYYNGRMPLETTDVEDLL